MGLMTDITLALGKGFMAHGLRLCQFRMTGKTSFRQAFSEQTIMARGMPGGDPLVVRVGLSTFALRLVEAACIRCIRLTPLAAKANR